MIGSAITGVAGWLGGAIDTFLRASDRTVNPEVVEFPSLWPTVGRYGDAPETLANRGEQVLEGAMVDEDGIVQPWQAWYDRFGRQIARTDWGNTQHHTDPHYHVYNPNTSQMWRGSGPIIVKNHEPGIYKP